MLVFPSGLTDTTKEGIVSSKHALLLFFPLTSVSFKCNAIDCFAFSSSSLYCSVYLSHVQPTLCTPNYANFFKKSATSPFARVKGKISGVKSKMPSVGSLQTRRNVFLVEQRRNQGERETRARVVCEERSALNSLVLQAKSRG